MNLSATNLRVNKVFGCWAAASLLAPLLGVVVAGFLSDAGPRSASAADGTEDVPGTHAAGLLVAVDRKLSEHELAAVRWFESRPQGTSMQISSPFLRRVESSIGEPETIVQTIEGGDSEIRLDVPKLRITGIMVGGGVNYVSLNHRLSRVGDEVSAGWSVRSINALRQTVEIQHVGGTVMELFVDRPRLNGGEPSASADNQKVVEQNDVGQNDNDEDKSDHVE